jgi:HD-GYP domain-containing protein (c-di-GMP phosphodiesterase class II)
MVELLAKGDIMLSTCEADLLQYQNCAKGRKMPAIASAHAELCRLFRIGQEPHPRYADLSSSPDFSCPTMLRVSTKEALSGMQLAVPVLHPQRGTMLLTEGFVLNDVLIRKLRELEIHDIWIEYPGTEQIKQYVSPTILQQQSQLVEKVAEMFDPQRREAHAEVDFTNYRKTIQGLIESLVAEPLAASYIVELGGTAECELRHASEVCFLSVLLGLKLQGYLVQQRRRLRPSDARDVVSLGVGAALHDIGMTALPQDVRLRHEVSHDDSDPQWRQHVTRGHKMVSGNIPPAAAGIVLHHHQHFDGSGFPTNVGPDGRVRGLTGEEIHVFARIVCVANHFDRLRLPPNGVPQPRVRVLKQMLAGELTTRFDPVILATLPIVVPAFPPGSMVTLNSGDRAVVTQWHAEAPCQPTVQLLMASDDAEAKVNPESQQYDLRNCRDLQIVEHDGIDVRDDQFRLLPGVLDTQKTAA